MQRKVDESWKQQARTEKAALSDRIEQEGTGRRRASMPPASLATILGEMQLRALVALGEVEVEKGKRPEPNLEMAQYAIDCLAVLQEKTEGQRTAEETRLLDGLLYDLRMRFVERSRGAAPGGG
ncbi:MAG: DUF1844 domain-containing protein [Planctomycetes bacterium]|nr:DUF1844 domain-containing protein [Planctomycetota bacterium]